MPQYRPIIRGASGTANTGAALTASTGNVLIQPGDIVVAGALSANTTVIEPAQPSIFSASNPAASWVRQSYRWFLGPLMSLSVWVLQNPVAANEPITIDRVTTVGTNAIVLVQVYSGVGSFSYFPHAGAGAITTSPAETPAMPITLAGSVALGFFSWNRGSGQSFSFSPAAIVSFSGVNYTPMWQESEPAVGSAQVSVTWSSVGGTGTASYVANGLVLEPAPVSVAIYPVTVNLASGESHEFTATVSGTSNQGVVWTASAGEIASSGLYTAPQVDVMTSATVTATSQAYPAATAAALVTVRPYVPPSPAKASAYQLMVSALPQIIPFALPLTYPQYLNRIQPTLYKGHTIEISDGHVLIRSRSKGGKHGRM